MKIRIFQKGFNYSQDGQGNRLVYHLQGCNMKCAWCANPEGMRMEGVLMTDKDWLFDQSCPRGAVKDRKLDRGMCEACIGRECLTARYKSKGLHLSYEEREAEELYQEILSSSPMFYDGGGVTFTGGEATMQFEALKALLMRLKDAGIHTAVETNGSHPGLEELFPYIDQLIMDCKHCEEEKHKRFTGISLKNVRENLEKASKQHKNLDVRIPLIGGVNDSREDIRGFLEFFEKIAGENVTFEILKYHEFGKNKWEECGWSYEMTDSAHVTAEQIREFKEQIIQKGFNYKKS